MAFLETISKPKTRKELFEVIWKKRRSFLAHRYGISEYHLLKVCKAYDIPYPSTNIPPKNPRPSLSGRPLSPISFEKEKLPFGFVVPPEDDILLKSCHFERVKVPAKSSVVSPFVKELHDRYIASTSGGGPYEQGVIVTHSVETQGRADAFMETLLKAVKKAGGKIGTDSLYFGKFGYRAIGFFGAFCTISIKESRKRIIKRTYSWESPEFIYQPTGVLTLRIEGLFEKDFQQSFTERKGRNLSDYMEEILTILFLFGCHRKRQRQEIQWYHLQEEAAKRKELPPINEEEYAEKVHSEFLTYFQKWKRAKEQKEFLKELLSYVVAHKIDSESVSAFKKWYLVAKEYVNKQESFGDFIQSINGKLKKD